MDDNIKGLVLDASKVRWHPDRIEAWRAGERIAPVSIDMALTQACNYRCEYCYAQLQRNPPQTITRDIIFGFLDDCAEIGVRGISLIGDGESTCVSFYADAITRGHDNGISMALGTHGATLTRAQLEQILPRLTYLRFNISAAEPKRYGEIMGTDPGNLLRVTENISQAVAIKRRDGLPVTIGLQMVFQPKYVDQLMPLARLGRRLGVDYLVIKHTSDDREGTLGVDYRGYPETFAQLREAETCSTGSYAVRVKWNKIRRGTKRSYSACSAPPFVLQISGTGLVAPCAIMFGRKYRSFHIGNIVDTPFRRIWEGERYWEVMGKLAGPEFDARRMCAPLCLADLTNTVLSRLKDSADPVGPPPGPRPQHINFI